MNFTQNLNLLHENSCQPLLSQSALKLAISGRQSYQIDSYSVSLRSITRIIILP